MLKFYLGVVALFTVQGYTYILPDLQNLVKEKIQQGKREVKGEKNGKGEIRVEKDKR